MNTIETAHHIMLRDPIKNYCAIKLLFSLENPIVVIERDSLLIVTTSPEDKFAILVPGDPPGPQEIFTQIPDDANEFFIIDDWPLEYILPGRAISRDMDCWQLHLPEDYILPEDDVRISNIDIDHADYIYANYDARDFTTIAYIRERINFGPAIGIIDNDRLIAWAMTHEEGTMGVLTVLPQYRRQGLATLLTTALSRRIRQAGCIPTAHIVKTNHASLAMSIKCGFIQNASIHWLIT